MTTEDRKTREKKTTMDNETEGRPAGNAVMREALKAVIEKLFDCAPTAEQEWPELVQRARDALSDPPRNCDRFADELDAQLAFLNEEWLISVDKDSMLERDRFENWTDEMRSAYARWLMVKSEGGKP